MKKMKIGIVCDEFGNLNRGGAEVQVDKTVEFLRKMSEIEVEFIDRKTASIDEYDIIHFFKSMYHYKDLAEWLVQKKIPYVVSTIYYPNKSIILEKIIYKILKKIPKKFTRFCSLSKRIELWKNASYLFPNTSSEKYFFESLNINKNIKVIKNGIDRSEMDLNIRKDLFFDTFPQLKNQKFILNVARIEKRKNQKILFDICKQLELPLVIIGKVWDKEILASMMGSYQKFYYLGPIYNKELLYSAYKACEVFALPSLVETPGIAAMEAFYFDSKVLITKNGGTKDYFKEKAWYIDPNDKKDITTKLLEAYSFKKDLNEKNFLDECYWENIVKVYKDIYNDILNK